MYGSAAEGRNASDMISKSYNYHPAVACFLQRYVQFHAKIAHKAHKIKTCFFEAPSIGASIIDTAAEKVCVKKKIRVKVKKIENMFQTGQIDGVISSCHLLVWTRTKHCLQLTRRLVPSSAK